jgi:hypothetical protein
MSWPWNHQFLYIRYEFLEILIYLERLDCLADQIFLARDQCRKRLRMPSPVKLGPIAGVKPMHRRSEA